jgi:hypothetical protein
MDVIKTEPDSESELSPSDNELDENGEEDPLSPSDNELDENGEEDPLAVTLPTVKPETEVRFNCFTE